MSAVLRNLLLLLIWPAALLAQFVELSGTVRDPQDKIVAGAVIQLDAEDSTIAESRSDAEGRFRFENIQPGSYTLHAQASGFDVVSSPIVVRSGPFETADLRFEHIAGRRESIVITASHWNRPSICEIRRFSTERSLSVTIRHFSN